MAERGNEQLTWGVELEFCIPALLDGKEDPEPGHRLGPIGCPARVRDTDERIAKLAIADKYEEVLDSICNFINAAFKENGIKQTIRFVQKDHPGSLPSGRVTSLDDVVKGLYLGEKQAGQTHYEVYSSWAIHKESLHVNGENGKPLPESECYAVHPQYFMLSFEVKTSVYSNSEELGRDLGVVMNCLNKNPKFRISNNLGLGDCKPGIHVHVGTTNKDGFDLVTAKRLVTMAWICEPAIFELHASWRANSSRYCPSLRKHSRLAEITPGIKGKYHEWHEALEASNPGRFKKLTEADYFPVSHEDKERMEACTHNLAGYSEASTHAIRLIWAAKDMPHLAWLTAGCMGNRRGALSLHGLCPPETKLIHTPRNTPLGTIEFRHMQTSMYAADTVAWIKVIERMMTLALDHKGEYKRTLMSIIQKGGSDGQFDADTLLQLLGLVDIKARSQAEHDREAELPDWAAKIQAQKKNT